MNKLINILLLCAVHLQAQGDDTVLYTAPKWHESFTNIPGDFVTAGKTLFSMESLVPLGVMVGSTAVLYLIDKPLVDGVQQFSRYIGLDPSSQFEPVIQIGDLKVMERPGNLNTGLYFIGEGWTSILIFGGIGIHGAITNNTKEVRMLSQALEGWLEIGFVCQLLKHSFGRETPDRATTDRGTFRPFPSLSDYKKNVSKYDAMPSGHMATMAFTVALLAEHYPDNRFIHPVGYSLIGICALSMLNNGVHWASDYPLGFGIGYLFAKVVARRGRVVQGGAKSNSLLNRIDVSPTMLFDGAGLRFGFSF